MLELISPRFNALLSWALPTFYYSWKFHVVLEVIYHLSKPEKGEIQFRCETREFALLMSSDGGKKQNDCAKPDDFLQSFELFNLGT